MIFKKNLPKMLFHQHSNFEMNFILLGFCHQNAVYNTEPHIDFDRIQISKKAKPFLKRFL